MAWKEFNNNPTGRNVGDCAVRAIAVALNVDWEKAYSMIAANGFTMGDMPSSNGVWGSVLRQKGFSRKSIPDTFYVLGFGSHVATVRNGTLYDSWDSSHEIPQYYWTNEKEGE